MAAISVSRRATAGIALIVAGALVAIATLLPLAGVTLTFLWALAYAAVAVALVILAIGAVNSVITKVAFIIGAVGWALLAILALGISGIPAPLANVAAFLAALGTLAGALVLLVGREVANTSALVFLAAAVLATILLLGSFLGLPAGAFTTLLQVLFAAALILTGVLFRMKERRR